MSTATMSPPRRTRTKAKPVVRQTVVTSLPEPEFVIHSPKNAATIQLNNLKDDVSWQEIFYWLKIREELQQSLWECNNGLVYTQEEAEAKLAKWLK